MHQLATEGGGFGPCGFGVPGVDANNKKTYVYDIDHRSNRCLAVVKVMDLSAIPVALGVACPVGTGAQIASAAGGEVKGYDMYGQYIRETVAALGQSDTCFSSVAEAPADALWTNTFGLPYKHAANNSPADITYVAPTGLNARGAFTWGGTFPAEVMHDYTVDRDNMFGDVRDQFATGDPIDPVTMNATIDAAGEIVITTAQVADGSDWLRISYDDNERKSVANGAGTVTYTLQDWYLSTRKGLILGIAQAGQLVDMITSNGTKVIINLTGVEPGGGGTGIPAPTPITVNGPFNAGGDGTPFWTRSDCMVGFDIDSDPNPDTWHTWDEVVAMDGVTQDTKDAIYAQLQSQGCAV